MLKKFGDLVEGDIIRGQDGRSVRVTKAYEVHTPEKMYEIENEFGEILKASGNHLWYIETDLDYSLHRSRRKEGKEFFSDLSAEAIELLLESTDYETDTETSLMDMVALTNVIGNRPATQAIIRIAESIGHIAENDTVLQDIDSGEMITNTTVRTYDARMFSQQILSLTGKKEYKNKWPLIVGRVVTTEEIVNFYSDAELPVMTLLNKTE